VSLFSPKTGYVRRSEIKLTVGQTLATVHLIAAIQAIILAASQKRNVAQRTIVATIMMPIIIEESFARPREGDRLFVAFSSR
jgi:hypothetical protein